MLLSTNDNDPYLLGRSDYERGLDRDMNPYEDAGEYYGTTFWESWFEGWDDAKEEMEIAEKSFR